MAKIRRYKLSWEPSYSKQVVGYRLYWSKGEKVNYDSHFFELGNVHEVVLPDILKHRPKYPFSIVLGISAVDIYGNESDIIALPEPYTTDIPLQPTGLSLKKLDDFLVVEVDKEEMPTPQTLSE